MVTAAELSAADQLTAHLENEGLAIIASLRSKMQPGMTEQAIFDLIAQEVFTRSLGKTGELSGAFLAESLRLASFEKIAWVKNNTAIVNNGAGYIARQMVATNSLSPLGSSGGLLSEYVMDTVDRTQDANSKGFVIWSRHPDAKACSWCLDQVQEFKLTQVFKRHRNCRCVKVRVR